MKTVQLSLSEKITERIRSWESSEERMQSGYAYEKTFVDMWQALGAEVMQDGIGSLPQGRNAKKNFKQVSGK